MSMLKLPPARSIEEISPPETAADIPAAYAKLVLQKLGGGYRAMTEPNALDLVPEAGVAAKAAGAAIPAMTKMLKGTKVFHGTKRVFQPTKALVNRVKSDAFRTARVELGRALTTHEERVIAEESFKALWGATGEQLHQGLSTTFTGEKLATIADEIARTAEYRMEQPRQVLRDATEKKAKRALEKKGVQLDAAGISDLRWAIRGALNTVVKEPVSSIFKKDPTLRAHIDVLEPIINKARKVKPKKMFKPEKPFSHFTEARASSGAGGNLYGKGIYLTESMGTGISYAGGKGAVAKGKGILRSQNIPPQAKILDIHGKPTDATADIPQKVWDFVPGSKETYERSGVVATNCEEFLLASGVDRERFSAVVKKLGYDGVKYRTGRFGRTTHKGDPSNYVIYNYDIINNPRGIAKKAVREATEKRAITSKDIKFFEAKAKRDTAFAVRREARKVKKLEEEAIAVRNRELLEMGRRYQSKTDYENMANLYKEATKDVKAQGAASRKAYDEIIKKHIPHRLNFGVKK